MKKIITLLALFSTVIFAQQKGTFTDPRDKKKYNTVKIGTLTWMAQNLDYQGDGFLGLCNGDSPKEKIKKTENCKKYGRLYDWEEAMKACPADWHLPSDKEWQTLVDFAGGDEVAGKKLKAKSGWEGKCKWKDEKTDDRGRVTVTEFNNCGSDEYGFSALPGGYSDDDGFFFIGKKRILSSLNSSIVIQEKVNPGFIGHYGDWWTATEKEERYTSRSYRREMNESSKVSRNYSEKKRLFSIRCVKEDPEVVARRAEAEEALMKNGLTDSRDGKNYKAVKISSQIWMAENLNYDVAGSKCLINDPEFCQKYGRLYNWETAKKSCPDGWHLPNNEEWAALRVAIDGEIKYLKAASGWDGCESGEDKYGFSALPSGYGDDEGNFEGGKGSWWWTADDKFCKGHNAYKEAACDRYIGCEKYSEGKLIGSNISYKSYFFSVRCIKD